MLGAKKPLIPYQLSSPQYIQIAWNMEIQTFYGKRVNCFHTYCKRINCSVMLLKLREYV